MKKIAFGAMTFDKYPNELIETAHILGCDGIALRGAGEKGVNRNSFPTRSSIADLRKAIKENGLEVAEFGLPMYGAHPLLETEEWKINFDRNIEFLDVLDIARTARIDTAVPAMSETGMSYRALKDFYIENFARFARHAAVYGIRLVWEFEPGLILNEPAGVVEVVSAVGEPNFSLEFDTCHAYNCSIGIGHSEKGMEISGGVVEFARMCAGHIGHVHLIDTDGTLVNIKVPIKSGTDSFTELTTSRHLPFGEGHLHFDEIVPAILGEGRYAGEWWVLDMELTPEEQAPANLEFVKRLNEKYCGGVK